MSEPSEIIGWHDYSDSFGGKKITTINPVVQSGSTVIFDNYTDMLAAQNGEYSGVTYGTGGLSTQKAFEEALCKLENGHTTKAFPSGISAIINTFMAFTQSGDEILLCDNVYGPTARFCYKVLAKYGVKISMLASDVGGEIEAQITDKTKLIFLESPGSNTFEIQDIRAIIKIASERNIITMIDNTWATPLHLKPLDLGVDVSIHSVTKYICGHSDVLLGAASVNEKYASIFDDFYHGLEICANSHDCYLALRGLRTLEVRLKAHEKSAFVIAQWLEGHALVDKVLHPGLPSHPQHDLWKRDFSGAAGLFAFTFKKNYSLEEISDFMNSLTMFGLGFSWGGFKSLITAGKFKRGGEWSHNGKDLIRLNIGLENVQDLRADLEAAFDKL
jgi:cystathionine beta-lyase